MSLNEMLLQDFHEATTFEMYGIVFLLLLIGFLIAFVIIGIFRHDPLGFYRIGQIDAINGRVKYKLSKNSNNEEVWTEIKE